MSSSNERTVVLGLMSYIDAEGRYRTATAGAVVKVHPNQLNRFDRLNVLMKPETAPAAAPVEVEENVEPAEPSDSWTIPQLQAFAKAREIDLGEATKKADILAAVQAAIADKES